MKKTKKALALIAASCLIGTSGVLTGLGATAHADGTLDNINPKTPRKLTIHKHEENGNPAVKPDGSSPVLPNPLADVEFTTYKITSLDLANKYQDWDVLAKVTANDIPTTSCAAAAAGSFKVGETTFTVEAGKKLAKTGEDGTTVFDSPDIAAYLVCETEAPAKVTVPARPFIATIPMPYNKSWLYDVHAYPKNEVGEAKKENVKQEQFGLGSKVSFKVSAKNPKLPEGYTVLKQFVISDTFDARLTFSEVPSVKIGDHVFTKDTDYTIVTKEQTARVVFTEAGLKELAKAENANKDVEVIFDTTVTSVGEGTIVNQAEYTSDPNDEFDPDKPKPGNPSNKVKTKWGNVKVLKYADKDEAKLLKDAKFEVYAPADDSLYPEGGECTDTTIPEGAQPISVSGQTTFTSDENGVVTIDGLFVSSSYKETDAQGVVTKHEGNESDTRCYILKEIEPPVGYVKVADPIALQVTAGETAAGTYDLKVNNNKQIVPGLPLTGAQGAIALTGGGIALVAIAAGALTVAHRRNKELA